MPLVVTCAIVAASGGEGHEVKKIVFGVALVFCELAGASSADADVRSTIQSLVRADNRRDLAAALAEYAHDAILFPPGLPPIAGTAAIQERYRELYANSLPKLEQNITDIVIRKDIAVVQGTTTGLFPAGPNEPSRSINDKFLMILRQQGKQWRILRLMWNSSGAPMLRD